MIVPSCVITQTPHEDRNTEITFLKLGTMNIDDSSSRNAKSVIPDKISVVSG